MFAIFKTPKGRVEELLQRRAPSAVYGLLGGDDHAVVSGDPETVMRVIGFMAEAGHYSLTEVGW